MRKLLPLLGVALLAAGCGEGAGNGGGQPGSGETVTYSRTGGLAGTSERLIIRPDGRAKLEVGYQDPATTEFTVPPAELDKLQDALAGFGDIDGAGTQTGCADCYLYSLTVGDRTIEADDTNFPKPLNGAREMLEKLKHNNYPGNAGPG